MLPRVWDKPVGDIALTNCSTYREIAIEACEISRDLLDAGRRPKDNGGWVLSYDPERRSFKSACIAIVFAGVWFEAAAHLAFVERHGRAGAKEFDI